MTVLPQEYSDPIQWAPTGTAEVKRAVYGNKGDVFVRFFMHQEPREHLSKELGYQYSDPIEMIEKIPDGKTVVHRMVTEADKREFPELYHRFTNSLESVGTMIENWGEIQLADRIELQRHGFRTVDQVAEASDDRMARVGRDAKELRNKAIRFVKARDNKVSADEIAGMVSQLTQQMAELKAQNDMLKIQLETRSVVAEEKRGRGRPKKIVTEDVSESE